MELFPHFSSLCTVRELRREIGCRSSVSSTAVISWVLGSIAAHKCHKIHKKVQFLHHIFKINGVFFCNFFERSGRPPCPEGACRVKKKMFKKPLIKE